MTDSRSDALQSLRSARLVALAGQKAAASFCKNLEGDFSLILAHIEAVLVSLSEIEKQDKAVQAGAKEQGNLRPGNPPYEKESK